MIKDKESKFGKREKKPQAQMPTAVNEDAEMCCRWMEEYDVGAKIVESG